MQQHRLIFDLCNPFTIAKCILFDFLEVNISFYNYVLCFCMFASSLFFIFFSLCRETPALSSRAFLSPRRRYPIHQPQYSMPGSLPTVYFDGYQKKCLLSPKSSLVRSPVTVKIARPDPKIARSPV